ncbi:MAG TPA: ABC transporter substrate-binding protein, partial [Thermomicrobiales bacterium]|nr:ABC transporter substrate-binding protein [Thermomicrobiales bacterium]
MKSMDSGEVVNVLAEAAVSRRTVLRGATVGGAIAVSAATGLVVPGLGAASVSAQDDSITLNVRSRGEIVNLDPHLGSGNPDATIRDNIYSKLVYTVPADPTKVLPDLATDWTVSADGLEYHFNLRKDAVWHKDYGPVTSKDVVWTFTRVKDPDLGSSMTSLFSNVTETVADGDYAVTVKLATPDVTFLYGTLADSGVIGNE